MGKRINRKINTLSSIFICSAMALLFLNGCATSPSMTESKPGSDSAPVIERVVVNPSPSETRVDIISSKPAPYTVFTLTSPDRMILDIRGVPGPDLPMITKVNDGNVLDLKFEEGQTQSTTTRLVANLKKSVDYLVSDDNNKIRLTFTRKGQPAEPQAEPQAEMKTTPTTAIKEEKETEEKDYLESEPHILFKPAHSARNQILGIDFTMLEHGKSRLTITSDKRVKYDLDRDGDKALVLKLFDTKVPPLLLRHIDTTQFQSALDRVTPKFSSENNELSLTISLREMVPFHVKQADTSIIMDFGRTTVKSKEMKIKPLDLVEARTMQLSAEQAPSMQTDAGGGAAPATDMDAEKKYKGDHMYLDFINADVTHILRLINEVSKENIIWDPAIAGRKVSMILKDVPWDQALDLILDNNELAKRYRAKNIIWITTKAKMNQKLAEEEAEVQKYKKLREEEARLKEERAKRAQEEEPLITDYLPVDFAKASEIKEHIILSHRGKMSIDSRTNTIIIKDTEASIEEAKNIVKQFDTPVKQIMIEARIVDASEDFSRDLGLQWVNNGIEYQRRGTSSMSWSGAPLFAVDNTETSFTTGGASRIAGGFTTNSPADWSSNIGISFAKLSGDMLSGLGLDAALALAEADSKAKIISAPKVIAREGTAASISSGDSIVIPATENVASTTLDATLSLTVTPSAVSYNNFITMEVSVTDDQAPSTSRLLRKAISTTLMIKSGETVVIGGIIKETTSKDENGVPILKDIPGVGWLFKAESKVKNKSELLIFITPTVLPSPVKTFG